MGAKLYGVIEGSYINKYSYRIYCQTTNGENLKYKSRSYRINTRIRGDASENIILTAM